jgi:hypothetical protein
MFEGKNHKNTHNSYKNHIRHQHSKATGFSSGHKGKSSRTAISHTTGHTSKHVMKGMSGYEQLRNTVMETAQTPVHNINQVTSAVKKSKVNAGI